MTYQVRQADHSERDLALALTRLWAENLAMSGDLDARLRWAYQDNPAGPGEVFLLEWNPDAVGPRPVGCSGILRRPFSLRGELLDCAMFGDFAVSPEHRTLGPAVSLNRSSTTYVMRHFALGYGFPNPSASGVARRVGHRPLGKMARYIRVLRHGHYLRKAQAPHLRWAAWVGPALDALSLAPSVLAGRGGKGLELSWVDRADARFDDLWDGACKRFPILGDRREATLNWRFVRKPDSAARFAILADRSDRVRAFAVVEVAEKDAVGRIKDFLARDEADLGALLDRLALSLTRSGCVSMSVDFLGSSRVVRTLEAAGFERRSERRPLMVAPGEGADPVAGLLDLDSWYLTDGDEDW